jgi:DNA-directed RNA polymerase specialized sigma24 family protein
MLYGIVRHENDAWDLAQEGFLQAWRSIHKFKGRSSFYTWLYSLTVNLAFSRTSRCHRPEGDGRPPISGDRRNPGALDRHSNVPAFLRQEKATIHIKPDLSPDLWILNVSELCDRT